MSRNSHLFACVSVSLGLLSGAASALEAQGPLQRAS